MCGGSYPQPFPWKPTKENEIDEGDDEPLKQSIKKELRQHQSTRQLMGIYRLTECGVKTAEGELVFYLISPDNLSVLSRDGIHGRVRALGNLLRSVEDVRMLALDSRESFQPNKAYYKTRLEQEQIPALRELLRQDMEHLDEIQASTASAREFALVFRQEGKDAEQLRGRRVELEKQIRDHGFRVRLAGKQDVMRLLAVYYCQDVTTEHFEDYDGARWLEHG